MCSGLKNLWRILSLKLFLECNKVIIDDVDYDRIYLTIDGEEYDIRTWSYRPIRLDSDGKVCAEMVRYTLFKMIMDDDNNGHGDKSM